MEIESMSLKIENETHNANNFSESENLKTGKLPCPLTVQIKIEPEDEDSVSESENDQAKLDMAEVPVEFDCETPIKQEHKQQLKSSQNDTEVQSIFVKVERDINSFDEHEWNDGLHDQAASRIITADLSYFEFPDGTVSDDDVEYSDDEDPDETSRGVKKRKTSNCDSKNSQVPSLSSKTLGSTASGDCLSFSKSSSSSSETDDSDADETEWRKQSWPQKPDIKFFDTQYIRTKPRDRLPNKSSSPLNYFELFFDTKIINIIVEQTNVFAHQCNEPNWKPVSFREIRVLIALLIQMGIHRLQNVQDYWSSDPLLRVSGIAETMDVERFRKIQKYLHLNDNTKMLNPENENFDKLFKIRPLLDSLNASFKNNAKHTFSQAIGASTLLIENRSPSHHFLQPIKQGFKIWTRVDSKSGYLYNFEVYTGKNYNAKTCFEAVNALIRPLIEERYKGHLIFDGNFCSPKWLQFLYNKGIYGTSIVRPDWPDMPVLARKSMLNDIENLNKTVGMAEGSRKKIKTLERGESKWRIKGNVGFVVYKDRTKLRSFITTAFHPKEKTIFDSKERNSSKDLYPRIVSEYADRVAGLHIFDRNRSLYTISRKSGKWWKRLLYFFIDAAITNAYVLYNTRNKSTISQKQFRLTLSRQLVEHNKVAQATLKRRLVEVNDCEKRKRLAAVPLEIRFANLGQHWPESIPHSRRCRCCSTRLRNVRSKVQCDRCRVPLCMVPCFKKFHEKPG